MPPPSCSIVPEASEMVCNPHAAFFDLPDPNEAVCNPHIVSFGLADVNEQCATHTPLHLSFFIPLYRLGGILSCNSKNKAV